MSGENWPGEWLRGFLEVCVLQTLTRGPSYGYAIAAQLEEADLGNIQGGTLYPLLTRFERAGLVEPSWRTGEGGPARKYYRLTEAGRAEHAALVTRWSAFSEAVGRHLSSGSRPNNPEGARG
ncbi:PadR family transcriptional regulator [Georgenia sp. EYE_87]|uniref:PadR family transcriptional regulator n=1 Tax=Georgenia sp. EYE_87 TaxID=2853448 RepID=UPI002003A3A7|nr:PadR family transcriptional regulator [Georgenia sp. EYE_87]MCK6211861.1 PadR family transcriptional regulator [Georgenia sp. EYE_87]